MRIDYLTDPNHECLYDKASDCDICTSCGEHCSYCENCGLNDCCSAQASILE